MRNWFSNYFNISKGEFNGIMLLVIFIVAMVLLPFTYRWLWPYKPDEGATVAAIQQLEKVLEANAEQQKYKSATPTIKTVASNAHTYPPERAKVEKPKAILFPFNPNTIDKEGWQKLGLSAKQAQVMINYVQKGGAFRKPEDLKKMYVISPENYERLIPMIRLPVAATVLKQVNAHQPKAIVLVEINGADTLLLDKIHGIGPTFARRIVKYRDRLGGFHKKEQLMEVFGLDSVKFQEIKNQVLVDPALVKRLNINSATFDSLKNNPYLRYKQINAILQYRKQHGNYSNFEDLKKIAILTPEILEQLAPYFSYSP
jgi:competence protein ComEA